MRMLLPLLLAAGITITAPAPAFAADVLVTSFGAIPNDNIDDTAAIQAAMDSLGKRKTTLVFAPGNYTHSGVLRNNRPGTTLRGAATLTATNEATSAFDINANDVTVDGLRFATPNTTQRWEAPDQHKLTVRGQSGVRLTNVGVIGSAAAGVFVDQGSTGFVFTDVSVRDTRADGIHMTGGANNGVVTRPVVTGTGDDGVAVVSYGSGGGAGLVHHIEVNDPVVTANYWGRGVSVVGGEDVTYRNVVSDDSATAGIYIASESSYSTMGVTRVQVLGSRVTRANRNTTVQHGGILIVSSQTPVRDVAVRDIAVSDTRADSPGSIRAVVESGGELSGIQFTNIAITGGPTQGYQGNAPSGTVGFTNVTKDGSPLVAP